MHTYNNDQCISLSQQAQSSIAADILERHSIEACGVLLGTIDDAENWLVEDAYPLPNTFNSPVYFEFDPEDLLNAELAYPGKIIGVYHSHPTGFAQASNTDRQNMQRVNEEEQIPWIWLIVCGPFSQQMEQQQLSATKIIAYHHFAMDGLQKIKLRLTSRADEAPTEA